MVGGPVFVYPECTMVRVGARVGPGGLPTCGEWIRASGQLLVSAAHVFCIVGARARGCPGVLEGEAVVAATTTVPW